MAACCSQRDLVRGVGHRLGSEGGSQTTLTSTFPTPGTVETAFSTITGSSCADGQLGESATCRPSPCDRRQRQCGKSGRPKYRNNISLARRPRAPKPGFRRRALAIWLVGQCTVFVRNREQSANPPVSLDLDDAAVERLTTLVSAWALAGLADAEFRRASASTPPIPAVLAREAC